MNVIEQLMQNPELLRELPKPVLEAVLELVKIEKMKLRSGGLPQSAVEAMTAVVDDKLMSQIAADGRRNNTPGFLKPVEGPAVERGSGWVDPQPLSGSVPGTKLIDEIALGFDERERAEKANKFVKRI